MGRKKKPRHVPQYRLHRASGRARVIIRGRHYMLGKFGSPESWKRYAELLETLIDKPDETTVVEALPTGLSINRLAVLYLEQHVDAWYRKDGRPTSEVACIHAALRFLKPRYGRTAADEFDSARLRAVRDAMIEAKLRRSTINKHVGRIKAMFRWAGEMKHCAADVWHSLALVPNLKRGRSKAIESAPVDPVPDDVVDATLRFLPPMIADMVRLQRLTGCRPGEVCIVRPCDLDCAVDDAAPREGELCVLRLDGGEASDAAVWCYTPESHKTEHHGHERRVFIGPRGQAVLRPYLDREPTAYCFSPAESERERNAERRDERRSPMTPSQRRRRPKAQRARPPREHYTRDGFRRAIARAVDLANAARRKVDPEAELLPHWHPNQLRHSAGTEIRRRFDLEGAQVVLGHKEAKITQVYAERDFARAAEIMRQIG